MSKTLITAIGLTLVIGCSHQVRQPTDSTQNNSVDRIKKRIIPPCEVLSTHNPLYKDSLLIEHIVNTKINKSTDLNYISDRKELIPLEKIVTNDSLTELWDSVYDPRIKIKLSFYYKKLIDIDYEKDYLIGGAGEPETLSTAIKTVNKNGEFYGLALTDTLLRLFKSGYIEFSDHTIVIPDSILAQFFNSNIDKYDFSIRPIEAYFSEDKKYIFIYLFGEKIDNTYFAKLVFDKNQYLTKIVLNNSEFIAYRCSWPHFVGF